MKALDTNILVRFLVADDTRQAQLVYRLFKNAERKNERFFVSLLVVLETLWVLDSAYGYAPAEIVEAVKGLLTLKVLDFEAVSVLREWLAAAPAGKADLSDLLIGQVARNKGCSGVLTFDKKASRHLLFEELV
ncbi:MAG: type II toxin-antitoxin system VapC family toxin [bacterium]